jgi:hypothetical protein
MTLDALPILLIGLLRKPNKNRADKLARVVANKVANCFEILRRRGLLNWLASVLIVRLN